MRQLSYLSMMVITVFATPVIAANTTANRLYFTESLGWTSMANATVNPYQFKQKQTFGYRLASGYLFPISDVMSIGPEIGYGYYGKESYQNNIGYVSTYKLHGWDLLANFKYKFSPLLNGYLKLGMGQFSQQLTIKGAQVTPGGFYQQAVVPVIALAASYNLFERTELSLNYTHLFANRAPLTGSQQFTFTNVNQVAGANSVLLGITYFI